MCDGKLISATSEVAFMIKYSKSSDLILIYNITNSSLNILYICPYGCPVWLNYLSDSNHQAKFQFKLFML